MPNDPAGQRVANDDAALAPLPPAARIQELLFDAARLGRTDVIPSLLQAGARIGDMDSRGYTPLILASYQGHASATSLLIDRGAWVDQPDAKRGNTALMGVAFKGYGEIAELLLGAGADPNAINHAGQSALMMAALFGHHAIADLLIRRGADLTVRDCAGNSAISVAEAQGNGSMVQQLSASLGGRA